MRVRAVGMGQNMTTTLCWVRARVASQQGRSGGIGVRCARAAQHGDLMLCVVAWYTCTPGVVRTAKVDNSIEESHAAATAPVRVNIPQFPSKVSRLCTTVARCLGSLCLWGAMVCFVRH